MPDPDNIEKKSLQELIKKFNTLEDRIKRIESYLFNENILPGNAVSVNPEEEFKWHVNPADSDSTIESNVIEYGLVWLSSIVYLFGIIFLMAYVRNTGYPIIASVIGYSAASVIFMLSNYLRKSFPHLVFVLTMIGLLLLYYVTLRLYYFDAHPIIPGQGIALALILAVIAFHLYYTAKKKSEFFGFISVLLILVTAIISDSTYITLNLILISSLSVLFYFSKYGWWRVLLVGMIFIYLAFLLWFLNNPLMGHPLQAIAYPQYSLLYLFLYAIAFSLSTLFPKDKSISDSVYGLIYITNALTFIILTLLEVMTFYENNYVWIFAVIALLCLVFSVLLKSKTDKLFTPAFYACFSFLALSIGIYGFVKFPFAYLLLAIQSLLVVSIALWYRSKIIVVVNTFLYLSILTGYLSTSASIDSINFTFAFVALATARILNWKKERLTLKTDLLRILYLMAGFIMVLYGLREAVPVQFVSISWMLAAIFYLVMSLLLKNNKYRWMSIITILFTGIHLLIVDMANMEIGFRVIAFIFFAVITLGISLFYSKSIKNKSGSQRS